MKFTILDARVRDKHEISSSKYQYLDELLDKTFVTDYFLDRGAASAAPVSRQSKP
jgi:hypothetical protein